MRIVQVCKSPRFSVSRTNPFEEVLRALPEDEKLFLVLSGDPGVIATDLGAGKASLGATRREMKRLRVSLLLRLWRSLKAFRPDVVIAHRITPTFLVALLQVFLPRCRRISFIHGQGQFRKGRRRLFARLFLRDWTFVAVSDAVRRDLVRSGIRASQIVVIRNAVDVDHLASKALSRTEARALLGVSQDALVVGTVGRLHPVKGQHTLIRAAALAKTPWHVVIVGDGALRASLDNAVAEHEVGDRVVLAGERPDAFRYARAYDVFVLPSLSEGLPLALIEAMALGVPSIGTPAGGIPEVLTEEAWRVPVGDPVALAEKLDGLLALAPTARHAVAERQQACVRARFGVQRFYRDVHDLIHGQGGNATGQETEER